MPAEKENFDQEDAFVKEKFSRRKALMEEQGEHAERSLQSFLKKALGPMGSEQRKSVARDIIRVSKEPPANHKKEFGFVVDDQPPTGYEPKPWEDDE